MPPAKKIILTSDGPKPGESVAVNSAQEHFNVYMLEDGTVLKMKTVLVDVFRIENDFDADGNPVYFVKSSQVVSIDAPDQLKRK